MLRTTPIALKRRYYNIAVFTSSLIITYSIYVIFFGWGLQNGLFDTRISGNLPIAIDSAYCFIFASLSLFLSLQNKSLFKSLLSRLLAVSVFTWTILVMIDNFTSIKIPFTIGMSPQTSFCFLLLSLSLYQLNTANRKFIIQGMLHVVSLISSIVIIGHLLEIPEFYRMSFVPMAIYSAIGLFLLSVSSSLVNRNIGLTGLFTGKLIGNIMARRLFIQMALVIIALGYLRLITHRRGWMSPELGIASITVAFLIVSLLLVWSTSKKLNAIHQKSKMAEQNFRTAVAAAPYALLIADRDDKILMVNNETRKLYGYKKWELLGQNIKMLIPEKLHEDYSVKKANFFASPSATKFDIDDELFAKKKDNSEFPVEIILTPVRINADTFVLLTIIDITSRKHHEEIIKRQVIQLQQKNEELEQFNYISSHDLQEPLRTVSNYITLLREDYPENLNEEMELHLGTMSSTIERMSRVVRSLLDFGKLGRNKKLVLTNCSSLLESVITDLGSLIKNKHALISIEPNFPEFYAYETELRQLFQNLINNAIKFSRDDTPPHIKISCKMKKGFYKFEVADNGIGINPANSEKIFHIFHRLNSDEKYEGHGIGLANCKKIVEMHGGQIWVESEPGKGSTFKFTILKFKT